MKKRCFLITTFAIFITSFTTLAQDFNNSTNKWARGWTNFTPNKTDYPQAEEKLPNIIANNTYLTNDVVYFMSGDVYVINNASLTIQEGTIIRCDHKNPANLIVTKGSKLVAAGSVAYPIVFTSNKDPKSRRSGDWGGITIAGSGKVNTVSGNGLIQGNYKPQYSVFGGNQFSEETTILRYIRIEFSGNTTKRQQGSNGLSLYGLGTSSIIDNIMVSHSNQDAFNIHGGENNIKNLISFKVKGNDYQFSEGFKGNLNSIMAIRHPYITSSKGSFAIAADGYDKNMGYTDLNAVTDATISNATIVNLSDKSNYQHTAPAVYTSNLANLYIHNSKISGFSDVVKFDESYNSLSKMQQAFMMDNSFFNIHGEGVESANKSIKKESLNVLKYNRFTKDFAGVEELFSNPFDNANPKFDLKRSLNTYMVMQ